MVVPLSKQTTDGTDEETPLCYAATWAEGAARASDARRSVRTFLTHAPRSGHAVVPPALAMDAELATSELVTNAIRHATGPIRLRLLRQPGLICEVTDTSNTSPRLRHARTLDEGGRGLFLVAQLTHRWGTRYTHEGKIIWAEQALPSGRPAAA